MPDRIPATLIPGDGIGPEVVGATLNIDQVRSGDLGGSASTAEFAQALVGRIRNG